MSTNEDGRQVAIAAEVEQAARSLAHSTRTIPTPADSYDMLGELTRATDHLEQTAQQLSHWHSTAPAEGLIHDNADPLTAGVSAQLAADALSRAASALGTAAHELRTAHAENSQIRWGARSSDQ
ncbi:MAG: hypothetical protein DI630_18175 [Gordonia sp. (in: high G+C Gram-positive bacteria)]|nr:MAG: hypothetical protein DI630_18175 [Gordonia sp. (in: high G+C Gram-positive bacteria)]